MTYINSRGTRVTTESAYLTPAVLARSNLTVLTGATATKVLVDVDEGTGKKRAAGVEFVVFAKNGGDGGERMVARSRREVVLTYVVNLS